MPVLVVPLTVAVNCCEPPVMIETLVGVTLTFTAGLLLPAALPDVGDGGAGVLAVAPPQPEFVRAKPIRKAKHAIVHSSLFTCEPFRLSRGTTGRRGSGEQAFKKFGLWRARDFTSMVKTHPSKRKHLRLSSVMVPESRLPPDSNTHSPTRYCPLP